MKKRVGIIVVTYNRLQLLKDAIESLRSQTYQDFDIIVINNGSTDETKKWLDSQNDIIGIHQENLGGAGGFFTGLKYVAENEYQYCWLMDDDVLCDKLCLEKLLESYKICPEMGFSCSLVRSENGEPMNVPNIDLRPALNGYPSTFAFLFDNLVKVESATFVSVLIPTKVIQDIGLPIKEFFLWGDDIEYTSRISNKYESYLVGKSIIIHRRQNAKALNLKYEDNPCRIRNYKYAYRNCIYILRKYKGLINVIGFIYKQLSKIPGFLFKMEFAKIYITLSGLLRGLFFNPPIRYPHNNENS